MRLIDADVLKEQMSKSHEYHGDSSEIRAKLERDIRIIDEQPTINRYAQDGKCAWCKIDTNKQPMFTSDYDAHGKCKYCNSYNDAGQQTIHFNSMRQIYSGAVELIDYICGEFKQMLDYAGVDLDGLKRDLDMPEDEPITIRVQTNAIVRELFLSHTHNSGGTSTGNLKNRLGIMHGNECFLLEDEDDYEG
jgi:hypothetical protein